MIAPRAFDEVAEFNIAGETPGDKFVNLLQKVVNVPKEELDQREQEYKKLRSKKLITKK